MPFCYNCGNKLLDGQKFCPNCGCKAATNINPQDGSAPTATSPAAPVQQAPSTAPAPNTAIANGVAPAAPTAPSGSLCRVREGKILAGVCTGLQAKFNLNVWVFRLLFFFVGSTGIGLIAYIIMAIALKYSDDPVVTQAIPAPTPDGDVWAQTGKSKTVAIVLSIFFGALGVDRFYMRRTRTGLIKLLVPSIGIWFIIDIVRLCTDKLLPLSRPARETIFGDEIYRVREGKMIAGVCSGLADKFNKNIWIFRGAMIAAAFHIAYRVLTVLIQHSFYFGFFWTFVAILCILLLILYLLIAVSQKDKSEVLAAKEEISTDRNANIAASGNAAATTGASNPLAEMYRIKEGKILAGVCTGLADKYKQNVWIFRILFLVIGTTGLSLIVYIALALMLKYKEDGNNEEGPIEQTEKKNSNILSEMYRLQQGKIFAGVCSGLGHKNKMNPWLFRILFIVVGSTGIGLIAYIALAVMLKYNEDITDESEINSETLGTTINKFFAGMYRIKEGKILAGVCTGLADKYKLNVWIFRAIALFTGIGSIIYIIFAIMLKYKDAPEEHSANDEIWEKAGKNRAIAIILSIFLGYLAVDRFYLRHTGKGLLKLVCPLAVILVGVILMVISSNIRNFDAIKVLSIISMVLIAIACVYMVVWYIVDIIRLAIGKILPKQKKEEDDFVAAAPQPAVEIKMSAAKTEPVEKLVPPTEAAPTNEPTPKATVVNETPANVPTAKEPSAKQPPVEKKVSLGADFAPEESHSKSKVPLIVAIAAVLVGGIIALIIALTSGSGEQEPPPSETDETISEEVIDEGEGYSNVAIGNLIWMTENMNVETEGSFCYDDLEENCSTYGRFYTWEAAMAVCPDGWRLPTSEEWSQLKSQNLKSSEGWENNGGSSNGNEFNAQAAGFRNSKGKYELIGKRADFWSSTEAANGKAQFWYFSHKSDDISQNTYSKSGAMSVRCVKNLAVLQSENEGEQNPASEEEGTLASDNCEPVVWAYIFDSDSTNIRDKAKGKAVMKIGGTPVLGLSSPNKGWWEIQDNGTLGNGVLKGSTTGYWIHGSVVRIKLTPTNGNSVSLKTSPADNAEVAVSVSKDDALIPVDQKDCWVNLKTENGKSSGWTKKNNINRAELEKIASAIKPVVQEELPAAQEEAPVKQEAEPVPQAKSAPKAAQQESEDVPARTQANYPKEEAKASVTGVVKIPATKSITVSKKAVSPKYFNDFLKQHKGQLQRVYQSLLNSSEPFETSYKIRIVIDQSDDSIVSVLDKSSPSQKAEKKHGLLFKQLAVMIKSSWEIQTRDGNGNAYIEFPLKFVVE